jgi:hypothetical protein
MAVFLDKSLPANATHRNGECMPTAMLSVLQFYAPQTQISPRHLLASCGPGRGGIGVLEAAMIFNTLGIPARAFSPKIGTVPTPTTVFKRIWGYERYERDRHLIKRQPNSAQLRFFMTKGHKVIICTDEDPIAHAHLLTGFTSNHFLFHDSRSRRLTRSKRGIIPESRPHSIMYEDELMTGWAAHEHHTLVISGHARGAQDRILAAERSLKASYRSATERALSDLGLRPNALATQALTPVSALTL